MSHTTKVGVAVSFPSGVLGVDNAYCHATFVEKGFKDGSIFNFYNECENLNIISTRTISSNEAHLLKHIP